MLTRGLSLVAAIAVSGCFGVGMGKVVPGAHPIKRAGGTWVDQGNGYQQWVGSRGDSGGDRRFGGVIAGRFGVGSLALGDRPAMTNGGALDLRLEVAYAATARVGLGAAVAWQTAGASGGGSTISRSGFPVTLFATAAPVRPFVVRAGGFVKPGTTLVDERATSGAGLGVVAGAGVNVEFIGWHFVAMVDWEREHVRDVITGRGTEGYRSDFYLLDICVIGW